MIDLERKGYVKSSGQDHKGLAGALSMERRLHARFNIYLPLSFFAMHSGGEVIKGSGITVNVSDGGAFFLSRDRRLKPGIKLQMITIGQPDRKGPANPIISASVSRVEKLAGSGLGKNGEIGVAVKFDYLLDFDAILGRQRAF